MTEVNIVVIGPSRVGKTSLINAFLSINTSSASNVSARAGSQLVRYKSKTYNVNVVDTRPVHDANMWVNLDPKTTVVLKCRSTIDPRSFKNCTPRKTTRYKTILVGTKADMQNDTNVLDKLYDRQLMPITEYQGLQYAEKIGAAGYVETSADNLEGVNDAFEMALAIIDEELSEETEGVKQQPLLKKKPLTKIQTKEKIRAARPKSFPGLEAIELDDKKLRSSAHKRMRDAFKKKGHSQHHGSNTKAWKPAVMPKELPDRDGNYQKAKEAKKIAKKKRRRSESTKPKIKKKMTRADYRSISTDLRCVRGRAGKLLIRLSKASSLKIKDSKDLYVVFNLGRYWLRSKVAKKTTNPKWKQDLEMPIDNVKDELNIRIMYRDVLFSDSCVGSAQVSIESYGCNESNTKINLHPRGTITLLLAVLKK